MKKLLSILTLLVTIVTGASAQTSPDYESYDWSTDDAANAVIGKHDDITIAYKSGSISNVDGHRYFPLGANLKNSDETWTGYLSISSTKQIEKIDILYCTNFGTSGSAGTANIAWVAWGENVTPNQYTLAHGTTTGITGHKAWAEADWETIDLSETEAYTVYMSRSIREFREIGGTSNIANFGSGNTINILGIKVYLVDEGAVKHTVTYSLGDGTGTAPTQGDVAEAGTFTVKAAPGDLVAPDGKEFKCWNDGTANYKAGATYTMGTSNVTLTAVYQKERDQKVIYSLVGEIGSAVVTADNATVNDGESLVFSNTSGRIKITAASGETFKAGDIISFTGHVGSSSAAGQDAKPFGVKYGSTSSVPSYLSYSEDIHSEDGDVTVNGTITLSEDSEVLYLGRHGGTTTTLIDLVISRPIPSENIAFTDVTTYVTENPIDFSEVTEFKAYAVESVAGGKANTRTVGQVPAGTALLLKADGAVAVEANVPIIAEAAPITNLLQASDGSVTGDASTIFAYSKSGSEFRLVGNTVTIPAGKAYLEITGGGLTSFGVNFEETTAVQNVEAAPAANEAQVGQKAFVNGHLVIFTEKGYVNALGQTVK